MSLAIPKKSNMLLKVSLEFFFIDTFKSLKLSNVMKISLLNLFKVIILVFCTHLMIFSAQNEEMAINVNSIDKSTFSSSDRNILKEIDTDGDGDPDLTDPFANNPCKFSNSSSALTSSFRFSKRPGASGVLSFCHMFV